LRARQIAEGLIERVGIAYNTTLSSFPSRGMREFTGAVASP